jgi:6-phosphofructokinase 1
MLLPGDTVPKDFNELSIKSLGEATINSPLDMGEGFFSDKGKVSYYADLKNLQNYIEKNELPPMFELAGPREKIYFDSSNLKCGIVTCGGLCPGLNDVVRSITLVLLMQYKVKKVLGFRYGYQGLSPKATSEPIEMTPQVVDGIQHKGGTILGTSRGAQDGKDMVDVLVKNDIGILFVIGGDGTFRGGHEIVGEVERRGLNISIIGVPKTIDNDIVGSEVSFGFDTSVEEGRKAIAAAHEEAKSAFNGVGMVKLMGRDSGFISSNASLANSDVNFCLVPEVPFTLEGENGLFRRLEKRLARREHAVIVVAEGAGQELLKNTGNKDDSGNVRYSDIGPFLKSKIKEHFRIVH